jgi:curli biogenesis system outer membrane secretion channel CsgG
MTKLFLGILAILWLVVPAAAQNNNKPVVGIAEMDDLTGAGQADNFVAMIETAIIGSGKFRIIERARLATLLKEQGLGRSGMVTTSAKKRTGGFEGVDYII